MMVKHMDWDALFAEVEAKCGDITVDDVEDVTVNLKPCPFCGGDAEFIDNGYFMDVSCKDLHCRGYASSLDSKKKKEAIEAWNRRADNASD